MIINGGLIDRARGALLGGAVGDALGAPYEFGPPLGPEIPIGMVGGGSFGWEPGEWTDDTAMAVAIAEVSASGADLRLAPAQDRIVGRWAAWARSAKDVGNQTRNVLGHVPDGAVHGAAATARTAADELHRRTGHTAGNGSLMRTAPVALAYLDDEAGLVEAATAISGLTHPDPEAGEACVLWCLAIRHAVRTGELDARVGLAGLAADRRPVWEGRLVAAEAAVPADFVNNGWVVEALQGAWSAIAGAASDDPGARFAAGVQAAVRGGRDTDTVAAIAGSLLGAACGEQAIPEAWRRIVHGWPQLRADGLAALAAATARS
jgi:ADP-ribosyl-[dinitrogen reductase] hydrolase